jgi:ABC-2 type transport system ATP-binding protein
MLSPAKPPVVSVRNLRKTYQNGFDALKGVDLDIQDGEILALLGPNGAGKTTLISVICGLVNPSGGTVTVGGHDIIRDYRAARSLIGLVPQEMHVDAFESVWASVSFSRGLFGKKRNDAVVEQVLGDLSLLDKRNEKIIALSGGMKRRVMIAKALVHEPQILFLDEPTAGVDVELRKSMWELIRRLNASGVTIILTTHYIEEAEQIADRVGVINKGELLLVEAKADLMRKMGEKVLTIELRQPIDALPGKLSREGLVLNEDGASLTYRYDVNAERTGISTLLSDLRSEGIAMRDISTHQNSLEDIFVSLVRKDAERETAR